MKLKFGRQEISFEPPSNIKWQVLQKETTSQIAPETTIIQNAVTRLLAVLQDKVSPGSKLLLIVPDHTRKCRLPIVLPLLLSQLKKLQLHIEILVANGSHVLQPEHVIRDLVGEEVYTSYPVFQHDCHDKKGLVFFGTSLNGTVIYLNKKVKEADFIITIGGILFHYFAGFGGGPKMLMPGVAGYESIRQNHRLTIDNKTGLFHKECFEGNIKTNPVYLDLSQIIPFVPQCTSLQFALNSRGNVVQAETGPILETQGRICPTVYDLYTTPVEEKAEIVIASAGGFPADVNLIQSHKSIHHAYQAVKPGGMIVLLAECPEGVGSETFMPYFEENSSADIGRCLLNDYKINGHTALSLKTKTENSRIYFVSKLDKEIVRKTGMLPCSTIEEALSFVLKELKAVNPKGYILPFANLYLPLVRN
ncbi:nickel-dependent lactate racemase [candidate division KSB1 bacterium]|nr:nickel-dependent lactate racemase [candidate division KSB1 bacterium]